jgi:hypothetical protein
MTILDNQMNKKEKMITAFSKKVTTALSREETWDQRFLLVIHAQA